MTSKTQTKLVSFSQYVMKIIVNCLSRHPSTSNGGGNFSRHHASNTFICSVCHSQYFLLFFCCCKFHLETPLHILHGPWLYVYLQKFFGIVFKFQVITLDPFILPLLAWLHKSFSSKVLFKQIPYQVLYPMVTRNINVLQPDCTVLVLINAYTHSCRKGNQYLIFLYYVSYQIVYSKINLIKL